MAPADNVSGMRARQELTHIGTQITTYRYHDQSNDRYVTAVYHQDYRHVWMRRSPSNHYRYTRKSGNMQDDGTCYYGAHHNYSEDRNNWPEVLFQYEPDLSQKGRVRPDRLLTPEEWLVLDLNSKPVRAIKAPLALSSKLEPFLMETIMRENYDMDIQVQDIRARMPGSLVNGVDRIRTATLSMAMNRFRNQAALISWTMKIGSENIKEYLDALLPPECLAANITRDFRSLYRHEIEEIKLMNAGHYPNKARSNNKDFSDANKQKQFDKVASKYRAARMQYDGSTDFTETYYKVMAARKERERQQQHHSDDDMDIDGPSSSAYRALRARILPPTSNPSGPLFQPYSEGSDSDSDDSEQDWEALDASPYHSSNGFNTSEGETRNPYPSIDFRHLLPVTEQQIALVQMMLGPTRIQSYQFTGVQPPQTGSSADYLTQYNQLQEAMVQELVNQGHDDMNAQLIGLVEFVDANWVWNGDWLEQFMGKELDGFQILTMVEGLRYELAMSATWQVAVPDTTAETSHWEMAMGSGVAAPNVTPEANQGEMEVDMREAGNLSTHGDQGEAGKELDWTEFLTKFATD